MSHLRQSVRDWSLLAKFGIISLVAITLIGLTLGRMLRTSVERQVIAASIAEAEVVSRLGLRTAIGPSELKDGLTPDRQRALQLAVRSDFAKIDVVDVVLWNLDNTVIFATDTTTIGQTADPSAELEQAGAGEAVASIVDLTSTENVDRLLLRHGTVLQVFQPIKFGALDSGQTAGVLRTSIPFGPVHETIKDETRRLYLALVCSFLILYAMLFRLVANASSELRRRADENERQARHDALTSLPNRTLFTEEVNNTLASSGPEATAVALIDLDRFKEVNDTLGHHHGDLLLIEVAQRLRSILRPNDSVARLGGDEFALMLTGVNDAAAALFVANRIVSAIEAPYEIEGLQLDVGASLGLAIAPDHGDDLPTLLQRADVAMYQAKRSGSGCALYNPANDHNSRQQLALAGELRRAMADELVVYYQPKVDLATNKACGVEALVRWQHPQLGLVSPDVFIPLAERGGLMNELTQTVLEQSLAELRRWLDDDRELHLAVNVSATGLRDSRLVQAVDDCLARYRIPADRLVLEITETSLVADPDRTREVLDLLRNRGVGISIDDFGTGYSSLAVLRSLPISELKIDRQFVADLNHPEGSAIVEYCIQLGHMLGMTVVAEGVEQAIDSEKLHQLGCDVAQGFWFARPMRANDLVQWLDERAATDKPVLPRQTSAT
ncbi:MAG: putative bifunctional diguanylate cyclase/phosphodiesterase [Acidimicrobiales bacterium]